MTTSTPTFDVYVYVPGRSARVERDQPLGWVEALREELAGSSTVVTAVAHDPAPRRRSYR